MSLLQKIKLNMFKHIPVIHGLSIIIVFSMGLSILMCSVVFPKSVFSYNITANSLNTSFSDYKSSSIISDESNLITIVDDTSQATNSNNASVKALILKKHGIVFSQKSYNFSGSSNDISFNNDKGILKEVGAEDIGKELSKKINNTTVDNQENKNDVGIDVSNTLNIKDTSINNKLISNNAPGIQKMNDTPVLTELSDEVISTKNYNKEIIPLPEKYAELLGEYKIRVNKEKNYFLENGVWYGYKYSTYKNFGKDVIPSIGSLTEYGLSPKTTLLAISGNTIYFVSDYTKIRLVSESVISGITNKERFLEQVLRDQKYIELESDTILSHLKLETLRITAGKSKSQKIAAIYTYVLSSIEYPETFNASNGKILSGISTYDSKIGSCGGYVNTFLYMLSFAGIEGAERIDGNVIDASDFPNIGHAWLRLDGLYYDPTFDDSSAPVSSEYSNGKTYYGLPYDIFYVNRYNFGTLPASIKTLSLQERKKIIRSKLSDISRQYDPKQYPIFRYYNVDTNSSEEEIELNSAPEEKNENLVVGNLDGLNTNKTFTGSEEKILNSEKPENIEDLKLLIPYYEVKGFVYEKKGVEYIITKMDFYTITSSNFNDLMNQVNYNFDGMVLYKWDNGTYRLAYSVVEQ